MLLALDRPAEDQLRAIARHQARQFADAPGRHAADGLGPFGGALDLVLGLAFDIGDEFLEAHGIGLDEFPVVQLLFPQGMDKAQHQRHVRHGVDVLVFAAQVVARLAFHRVDADHRDLAAGHLLLEPRQMLVGLVRFGVPPHLQVLDRVAGPEHQHLRLLEDDLPRRALRVHLGRPEHIGQDGLAGAGRVVARRADAVAVHPHRPQHMVAAAMHLSHRAPADVAHVQPPRAVVLLDTLQLVIDQIQRFVPAHPDEPVVAARRLARLARGRARAPVAIPVQAHHRVTHARWAVQHVERAVQNRRGVLVELEWLYFHHVAGHDPRPEGAPMGAREPPAAGIGRGRGRGRGPHHIAIAQKRRHHEGTQ